MMVSKGVLSAAVIAGCMCCVCPWESVRVEHLQSVLLRVLPAMFKLRELHPIAWRNTLLRNLRTCHIVRTREIGTQRSCTAAQPHALLYNHHTITVLVIKCTLYLRSNSSVMLQIVYGNEHDNSSSQ